MRKLIVGAFKDAQGQETIVIKPSSTNPAWGSVMVIEVKKILVKGAKFETKRVGFYRDKLVNLEGLGITKGCDLQPILAKDLGEDFIEQRVVICETTKPQYVGHKVKINPETKQAMVDANGLPIYYQAYLDNFDVADVKIATSGTTVNVAVEVEELTKGM